MSEQYCAEHDFYYSPNHIIDVVCPWCEIDRLNKEINRLRQYEDAITSAVDGTLLVWNLMSTNHTVIKNDYWQNHLEEIDRLKAELEEANAEKRRLLRLLQMIQAGEMLVHTENLERQLAEVKAEVERLKSQPTGYYDNTKYIEQARRDATKEVAKAHKRGWEQAKREAVKGVKMLVIPYSVNIYDEVGDFIADAIAAMEYKEDA